MYTFADVLRGLPPGAAEQAMTIREIVPVTPFPELLPLNTYKDLLTKWFRETGLDDPGFRNYNQIIDATTEPADAEQRRDLKPMSSRIDVEHLFENIENRNEVTFSLDKVKRRLRAMAMNFPRVIIGRNNGPSLPKGMYGLIEDNNNSNNVVKHVFAPNGAKIIDSAPEDFGFAMRRMLDSVAPHTDEQIILISDKNLMQQAFALALQNMSVLGPYIGKREWISPMGLKYTFNTWDGVMWVPAGHDAMKNAIMPFDETQGTSNVTSSILTAVLGDEAFHVGQARDTGIIMRRTESPFVSTLTMDWPIAAVDKNSFSLARTTGFLAN